ncbi:insecticidal delta-endotoxin Cry8Ea1 family protein, partial [Bacillus toyonensis]|uniref:insecticidal delta-endotoxin Cry8Ea1 family protein n=1 Tax=Bacillus toyonensis TaxID=155322 RepID=UPI000BEF8234
MNLNDNKNEFEIMGNGSMSYQPRYPLAQAPGSEFQGMNYKDWMNRCANGELGELFVDSDAVKNGVVAGLAITSYLLSIPFPFQSAALGIISVLLPILWPEQAGNPGTTEAQFTWDQWMKAAEKMADQKIADSVKTSAINTTKTLQSRIADYKQAICNLKTDPNNEAYKEEVRRQFNDADDWAKATVIEFGNSAYAIPLLADYAQAANVHLLLLQDGIKFGESWGFSALKVQQLYSNTSVGNPGMKELLAIYTDHCVRYYNEGLKKRYETGNWYTFNDYRKNMTLMVMDIVSFWPTYDPILYPVPTKSQLTRTVYTDFLRDTISPPAISDVENSVTVPLGLFRWMSGLGYHGVTVNSSNVWMGLEQLYHYTLRGDRYEERQGEFPHDSKLLGYLATASDDVWSIIPNYTPIEDGSEVGYIPNTASFFHDFRFQLLKSGEQRVHLAYEEGISRKFGLPCKSNTGTDCDPCQPCTALPNASDPCDDKSLYSHRFSYMGIYNPYIEFTLSPCFGWTHVSADANNLIDAEKITQIPAVKAYAIATNSRVVKGPGSTGGDVVQLSSGTERGVISMWITTPPGALAYRVRIRYASSMQTNVEIYMLGANGQFDVPATTTDLTNLTYNKFKYLDTVVYSYSQVEENREHIRIGTTGSGSGSFILDKIEFIPIRGSVEEFEANQALEKARKEVNALFTGDAKSALKLNITDYAVDQASNLVECVSDEFHAQEKMILVDQVKYAKRLSHARNLLNYGDFESSDWSGENGWKTSHHVHVTANNPIFKGRYLHMPGATSSQFSNTVYPTYIYQKVDESKLKSYTRYLVRGFVGNSKDLELLVERYGKDVHVEMDVPNDIRYSLPMNECG